MNGFLRSDVLPEQLSGVDWQQGQQRVLLAEPESLDNCIALVNAMRSELMGSSALQESLTACWNKGLSVLEAKVPVAPRLHDVGTHLKSVHLLLRSAIVGGGERLLSEQVEKQLSECFRDFCLDVDKACVAYVKEALDSSMTVGVSSKQSKRYRWLSM